MVLNRVPQCHLATLTQIALLVLAATQECVPITMELKKLIELSRLVSVQKPLMHQLHGPVAHSAMETISFDATNTGLNRTVWNGKDIFSSILLERVTLMLGLMMRQSVLLVVIIEAVPCIHGALINMDKAP